MYLTPEDKQAIEIYRKDIEQVALTGRQINTAAWYVMADIKMKRTGMSSDGHCPACVMELYRDFHYMLSQ